MVLWGCSITRRLYSVDCEDSWLLIAAVSSALISKSVDTWFWTGLSCRVLDHLIHIPCLTQVRPWQDFLGVTAIEYAVAITDRNLVLEKNWYPLLRNVWFRWDSVLVFKLPGMFLTDAEYLLSGGDDCLPSSNKSSFSFASFYPLGFRFWFL